jgi:hypothetical protein
MARNDPAIPGDKVEEPAPVVGEMVHQEPLKLGEPHILSQSH